MPFPFQEVKIASFLMAASLPTSAFDARAVKDFGKALEAVLVSKYLYHDFRTTPRLCVLDFSGHRLPEEIFLAGEQSLVRFPRWRFTLEDVFEGHANLYLGEGYLTFEPEY